MKSTFIAVLLAAIFLVDSASAAPVEFKDIKHSWYSSDGVFENGNTYTGMLFGLTYNSFYNFDLGTLPTGKKLTSATITFAYGYGYYESNDASETLQLWDVASIPGIGNSLTVFEDLQSGVKYGETKVLKTSSGLMPSITINLDKVSFSDLLQGGFFSIGAHVPTAADDQGLWGFSGSHPNAATLALNFEASVPEPSSVTLFGIALYGLIARFRKTHGR